MKKRQSHGDSVATGDRRLYRLYRKIISRCENPKQAGYRFYGGKGIKMYSQWRNDYKKFKEWAYKNGYKQGLQIDRIDNDKDYSPQNCRWVSTKEQARNKGTNVFFKGECAIDASLRLSNTRNLVSNRIILLGWDIEKAFTTPLSNRGSNFLKGKTKEIEKLIKKGLTQKEIAKKYGVTQSAISRIIKKHD